MESNFNLGLYYLEINLDSSVFYLDKTITLGKKLGFKINAATALHLRGYMLMMMANYPRSLESFSEATMILEDPANEDKIWFWKIFKDLSRREARLSTLGFTYHNLGHLYGRTGDIKMQTAMYFKAREIAVSVQSYLLIGLTNMNLGSIYIRKNQLDSALNFCREATRNFTNEACKDKTYLGNPLIDIGTIYKRKNDLALAKEYYQQAVKVNTRQNNLTSLIDSYIELGSLYQTLHQKDSALYYAKRAREVAELRHEPMGRANAYKFLSNLYNDQSNNDSAYVYLKLSSSIIDSMNKVERNNQLAYQHVVFDEQLRLKKLEEEKIQTQTRIKTYTLLAGLAVSCIIGLILYRSYRSKQVANNVLKSTLSSLKATQTQLIHAEKMASLGELTAGIAHEIQNPLNFVNNFSELNTELIDELDEEADNGNMGEVKAIAKDIKENEQKINHHGKRADAIVKGMLQHSRSSSGQTEPTDINALCDEYLRLSYHGLRAKDKSFNARMKTDFDKSIGYINIIPQDIGRVILNLINNAFYAVDEKKAQQTEGYEPTVTISTKKLNDNVEIIVADNGNGIPQKVVDKIFQPFFTTKPTGQGTGLGLSLSYDIIKAHGGEISVQSIAAGDAELATPKGDTQLGGTVFVITLPV